MCPLPKKSILIPNFNSPHAFFSCINFDPKCWDECMCDHFRSKFMHRKNI